MSKKVVKKTIGKEVTSKEIVIENLKDIFKDHIGIENAISSENLYFKVTGEHASSAGPYKREYKWNAIKRVLMFLRREGILFVVSTASYLYVLDSREELNLYKESADAKIKGLHKMKKKAEKWTSSPELIQLKKASKKLPAKLKKYVWKKGLE